MPQPPFPVPWSLKPDNVVAKINLQYNADLQAGRASRVRVPESPEDEFGKARTWDGVIGEDGPFDEPNFSYQQGLTLARNNLQHQAAQQFGPGKDADAGQRARPHLAGAIVYSQSPALQRPGAW